jgi:hypothetical protein
MAGCNWAYKNEFRSSRFSGTTLFGGSEFNASDTCWQATAVEGTIQQLFEGHHMNYIECINVDYKSTRKESFYGMQISLDKVL